MLLDCILLSSIHLRIDRLDPKSDAKINMRQSRDEPWESSRRIYIMLG